MILLLSMLALQANQLPVGRAPTAEEISNMPVRVRVPYKWIGALDVAISDFRKVKRKDSSCFEMMADIVGSHLRVAFVARSKAGTGDYHGQAPACGATVTYEVTSNGRILSRTYLR